MNKNIRLLMILLITVFIIGDELKASVTRTSETITIHNKNANSLWVSTKFDLTQAIEIKSGSSKDVTLSAPGIFAYIAKQELPFTTVGSIGTTLGVMYFKNNGVFRVYNQNFIVNSDSTISFYNSGILDPLNNIIEGNNIYIFDNGFRTATGLIATDGPTSPY